MCGEFGEVTAIIGLVINFLAVGTLLLNSHDTLTYSNDPSQSLFYFKPQEAHSQAGPANAM